MNLSKILKNVFIVVIFGLIVTACATKKSVKTTEPSTSTTTTTKAAETQKADPIEKLDALMQGDVYIGSDTVGCLLYTSPSPRDGLLSRMPSSA